MTPPTPAEIWKLAMNAAIEVVAEQPVARAQPVSPFAPVIHRLQQLRDRGPQLPGGAAPSSRQAGRALDSRTPATDVEAAKRMLGVLEVCWGAALTPAGDEAVGSLTDGIALVIDEARGYVAALQAAHLSPTPGPIHDSITLAELDASILPVPASAGGSAAGDLEGRRGSGDGHGLQATGRPGEVGGPAEAAGGEGLLRASDAAVAGEARKVGGRHVVGGAS